MKPTLGPLGAVLFCCLGYCLSYELGAKIVNDPVVAEKWVKASLTFDDLIWYQKDVAIKLLTKTVNDKELELNETCSDALTVLRNGLIDRKLWAYKFLDSSAKGKSGLAYGYVSDLGHYDQCLTLIVDEQLGAKRVNFEGQFCLAKLAFPLPKKPETNWLQPYKLNLSATELKGTLYEYYGNYTEFFFYDTFTFAMCVPTVCSREEIDKILKKEFSKSELKAELRPFCEKYEAVVPFVMKQSNDQLLSLLLVFLVIVFTIFSTLWTECINGNTFLCHFSVVRNTRKLFSDYKDPNMQKIQFLDGYKFWYHCGGCFAHMTAFLPATPLVFGAIQDLTVDMDKYWWFSEYAKRAIYTTQVIFLISGFMSSYYMYPIIAKAKGNLSFMSFACKRWLRTAPVTAGCLILWFGCISFFHGPLAQEFKEKYLNICRKNWWKTMLYINNWQPSTEICLPTTWSQSVDFQLWLLSYFPLIWLYKKPKLGVYACLFMIALGIIIPVSVTYAYNLPSISSGRPTDLFYHIAFGEYFPHMHLHTYNNMANYYIGFLLGYICVNGLLKPRNELVMWIMNLASIVTYVSSIYFPYVWTHFLGFTWTRGMDLVYAGTFRVIFISVFYMLIYGCFYKKGMGQIGGWFLSFKIWIPLGRMGYSVYMAQLIPIAYSMTTTYEYVPINRTIMAIHFLSILFFCWVLGYLVFLIFEGPFVSIAKGYTINASTKTDAMHPQINGADGVKKDN